jgi:4-amino-4-deoxy-L-arabinose transferase-like glycosyltransferase
MRSSPDGASSGPSAPSVTVAPGLGRLGHPAVTGLIVFALLAAIAGWRPLLLPDEGRYVGVAWAMLASGDWLTPTLSGLPYFHKPPLFYWLSASAMGLFGPNGVTERFAPLLGATLGAVAMHRLLLVRGSAGQANAMLAVLLSLPLFAIGAQYANLDMLVAGLITATICTGAEAALRHADGRPVAGLIAATWALAGLGLLAKGLIGFVLPGLVLLVWLSLERRWAALRALAIAPVGWVAFAGVAAPWFVLVEARHPGVADYFFLEHHVRRFTSRGFNNMHGPWFYPVVLALLAAPALPGLGRRVLDALRRRIVSRPVDRLCLVWAVVIVGFFTWPASKLVGYVLPAVPPLAALAAGGLVSALGGVGRWRRVAHGAPLVAGVLVSLVAVAWLTVKPPRTTAALAQVLQEQHRPGEPVWWLDEMFFDVGVTARIAEPPRVVADWASPDIDRHDDWRRELMEATRFAPDDADRLVVPAALPTLLCRHRPPTGVHWLLGNPDAVARFPGLGAAEAVATAGGRVLWRLTVPDTPGCGLAAAA